MSFVCCFDRLREALWNQLAMKICFFLQLDLTVEADWEKAELWKDYYLLTHWYTIPSLIHFSFIIHGLAAHAYFPPCFRKWSKMFNFRFHFDAGYHRTGMEPREIFSFFIEMQARRWLINRFKQFCATQISMGAETKKKLKLHSDESVWHSVRNKLPN